MKALTKTTLTLAGAALALGAGAAQAQQFYINGGLEAELVDFGGGGDDTLLFFDANLGFMPSPQGAPISGHLGFEAFSSDFLGADVALYPYITFHPMAGDISLGIVRPAIDSHIHAPFLGGNRWLSLLPLGTNGSVLPSFYLLGGVDAPVGVRYDGSFANGLDVGASYHNVDGLDVFNLGTTFHAGNLGPFHGIHLTGAVEAISNGGSSTNFYVGTDANVGNGFHTGLLYSSVEFPFGVELLQAYLSFSPLAKLELTAQVLALLSGSNDTAFSLNARYNFLPNVYGEVGYIDGDIFPNGVLNVALGVRFGN